MEWICASGTMVYLLLFKIDFETITVKEPEIFVADNFTVNAKICSRRVSNNSTLY